MKKSSQIAKLFVGVLLGGVSLNATSLSELFNAIKQTPDTKIDNVLVKEMKTNKKDVVAKLYPKVELFSSYEHFSTPANVKPMPPTVSAAITRSGGGYWFSRNIFKVGFDVSMPLFVKSIYDNKKKLQNLISAKKYQAKLNLLKREALLVGLVSKFDYLLELKKALIQKENSIKTTLNAISVGVEVGRIPKFKELKLQDALNQVQIKLTEVDTKIDEVKAEIYKLTKKDVFEFIPIEASSVKTQEFLATKPIKESIKAMQMDVKAKKDDYLPKLFLNAKGYRAFAKAYDNDDNLALNFASIGLYLKWNVFDKSRSAEIEKSKISLLKTNLTLQKTIKDLSAEVKKIKASIKDINRALSLQENSIALKEELLKSAKVAFEMNRMSVDDYLNYETDLANAKANLANLKAIKNSLLANLAFIYGNNLERVFK